MVPPTGVRCAHPYCFLLRSVCNYVRNYLQKATSVTFHDIIFDFDGTLVDSQKDVVDSLRIAFNRCRIPIPAFDISTIVQLQMRDAIRATVPAISPEQIERVVCAFRKIYDSIDYPNTTLMPTAAELLQRLKASSTGMFIVSNKRMIPTIRILEKFDIRRFFAGVFNPDMHKGGKIMTKCELLTLAIKKHSLAKNATVYIGDSEIDMSAAKENGIPAIAVENGYGDIPSFAIKPDYTVRQIIEVLTI
jgi:phosphoglycolate phosphatase